MSQTTTPSERDESTTEYYERRQSYIREAHPAIQTAGAAAPNGGVAA